MSIGIDLRDELAAHALAGILAAQDYSTSAEAARAAYRYADAMLAARDISPKGLAERPARTHYVPSEQVARMAKWFHTLLCDQQLLNYADFERELHWEFARSQLPAVEALQLIQGMGWRLDSGTEHEEEIKRRALEVIETFSSIKEDE